jgi:hypothetical protein
MVSPYEIRVSNNVDDALLRFSQTQVDMDLCCLIDAEDRPRAADLVTIISQMLERGATTEMTPQNFYTNVRPARNEIPRQTPATCANTHHQACSRRIRASATRPAMRYWVRKSISLGEHTAVTLLSKRRPRSRSSLSLVL